MAEYSARLIRIQQAEKAMFDLTRSGAENIIEAIKSHDNDYKLESRLIDSKETTGLGNPTYNPVITTNKINPLTYFNIIIIFTSDSPHYGLKPLRKLYIKFLYQTQRIGDLDILNLMQLYQVMIAHPVRLLAPSR